MISISSLKKRMKKCNPNIECGLIFSGGDNVTLYWDISLFQQYTIELKDHQLNVECHEFQRAMHKAQTYLKEM